ncbi:MAG: beta-ketoacyl-[acyl-carrier-protein] synthase family protein [Planctomycetota bacterium]|jgi:3-oxoacyl-[acyl-carrier-protein] synthase-1/3-oxoacyl-[acyl-carrier-protein] synthase II
MTAVASSFSPIIVSGIGGLCAAGANVPEIMSTIYSGLRRPVVSEYVRADHLEQYPMFELPPSAVPDGYYEGPESERCGLLAIAAACEAVNDAGLDLDSLKEYRVGVCIGTTVGNAMNNESFYRDFLFNRFPGMQSIKTYLKANPADMVARHFRLKGMRQCIANACSSGAVAIGQAAEWINNGLCDIAIAGGSDMLCRVIYNGFVSLKITDSQPCRPFDKNRLGLNLGEGAGMVVLESSGTVRQRKARTRATLCGYGNCSDAYHISAPMPDGVGLEMAISLALQQAQISHDDIAFINAHGTATPENDKVEGVLFSRLFPQTPFHSTKGYTGHTLGAAGAIEAIITTESLKRQMIAANVGFSDPDPEFAVNPVTENTPVAGDYALSDSVAFGGNNAVLVFRRTSEA